MAGIMQDDFGYSLLESNEDAMHVLVGGRQHRFGLGNFVQNAQFRVLGCCDHAAIVNNGFSQGTQVAEGAIVVSW